MSARYSTSPTLHLRIGESRLRAALYGGLCGVCVSALWLLYVRGYALLVVLCALWVTYLLWHLRRDPLVDAQLRWRQGIWTLEYAGVQRIIVPGRRSTATPWVIYLAYTEQPAGCCGHLWLYIDSASAAQLRRLRVRLTLDC